MSIPEPESRWSRVGEAKQRWRREELRTLTLERACEEFAEALDRAETLLRQGPQLDHAYLRKAIQEVSSLAHRPDLPERMEALLSGRT